MNKADNYLLSISNKDAVKLSRQQRRQRDRLLSKQDKAKSNIARLNNVDSDNVTITVPELKRLIDEEVKKEFNRTKNDITTNQQKFYNKTVLDMFVIIAYMMFTEYGFKATRLSKFTTKLIDLFSEAYGDGKLQSYRDVLTTNFKINLYEQLSDIDGKVIEQLDLNLKELYDNFSSTVAPCS